MEAVAESTSPLDKYTEKFTPPIHILERDNKKGYIKFQHSLGSGVTKEVREAFLAGDPNNPTAERYRTFDTDGKVDYGRIRRSGEISLDIYTRDKGGIMFGFSGWPAGPTLSTTYQSSELIYLSLGKPATSKELTQELEERKRYEPTLNLFRFDGEWYFNFDNKGVSAMLIDSQLRVSEETESLATHKLPLDVEIKEPESRLSYQVEPREDGSLTIIGIGMKTTLEIRGNLDLEYWQGVLYMVDDKSWEDCLKHLPIAFSAENSKTIE